MNPLNSVKGAITTGFVLAILLTLAIAPTAFNEFQLARWLHILAGVMRRKQRLGAAQRGGNCPGSARWARWARLTRHSLLRSRVSDAKSSNPLRCGSSSFPNPPVCRPGPLVVVGVTAAPIVSQQICRRKRRALADKGFSLSVR